MRLSILIISTIILFKNSNSQTVGDGDGCPSPSSNKRKGVNKGNSEPKICLNFLPELNGGANAETTLSPFQISVREVTKTGTTIVSSRDKKTKFVEFLIKAVAKEDATVEVHGGNSKHGGGGDDDIDIKIGDLVGEFIIKADEKGYCCKMSESKNFVDVNYSAGNKRKSPRINAVVEWKRNGYDGRVDFIATVFKDEKTYWRNVSAILESKH